MFGKIKIVHNLNDTGLFTRSKIAELTGISLNDVYQILKKSPEKHEETVYSDDRCIFAYCPNPEQCKEEGCTNMGTTCNPPPSKGE